jgi:hypothetical protein
MNRTIIRNALETHRAELLRRAADHPVPEAAQTYFAEARMVEAEMAAFAGDDDTMVDVSELPAGETLQDLRAADDLHDAFKPIVDQLAGSNPGWVAYWCARLGVAALNTKRARPLVRIPRRIDHEILGLPSVDGGES